MTREISFKEFMLSFSDRAPMLSDFKNITSHKDPRTFQDIVYKLYVRKNKKFVYLSFKYCNTKNPKYSDLVFDIGKNKDEKNLNSHNQIPYDSEFFCLYNFNTDSLLISNYKKLKFLENLLTYKHHSSEKCNIKRIISEAKMLDTLAKISEIKLTSKSNDLLDEDGNKIVDIIEDRIGLGASKQLDLSIKFNNKTKSEKFKEFFNHAKDISDRKFIVIGEDDNGGSLIFDDKYISHPIELKIDEKHIKDGFCDMYHVESELKNLLRIK